MPSNTKNDASNPVTPAAQERFAALASEPLRVVAPTSSFFSGSKTSLLDIWKHRQLWWLLTKREVKARYKDSAGGFVWSLIRPLVLLLIYYFVIGKVLGAADSINDFAVHIFAGLTAWTLFSTIVSGATQSIVGNSGIVKKIYLPREVFPLASAGSAFVDFLAQFAILFVAAFVIGGINWAHFLIYTPISILMITVWGIALGILLAGANVYLRDTQYLVEVVLSIGFWLTPSLYAYFTMAPKLPDWLMNLYLLNPTAIGVLGIEQGVWTAGDSVAWPAHLFTQIAIMLLVGLVLIFVNQRIFSRMQRNFAQEL
ncbi:MAG: ABC transporter permease [Actinomycetaceae bacterium]|nr:ABC transporter permease [Actinomycetaceae bacterium]